MSTFPCPPIPIPFVFVIVIEAPELLLTVHVVLLSIPKLPPEIEIVPELTIEQFELLTLEIPLTPVFEMVIVPEFRILPELEIPVLVPVFCINSVPELEIVPALVIRVPPLFATLTVVPIGIVMVSPEFMVIGLPIVHVLDELSQTPLKLAQVELVTGPPTAYAFCKERSVDNNTNVVNTIVNAIAKDVFLF